MKRRGGKQLSAEEKIQRQVQKLEKGNLLNMHVLESLNLLNEFYPISKQIFIKTFTLKLRQRKNYRIVKKQNPNYLIDCRTKPQTQIVEKEKNYEKLKDQKEVNNPNRDIQIDNQQLESVIYVSTVPSRFSLGGLSKKSQQINQDSFISSESEQQIQQSKTQTQKQKPFDCLKQLSPKSNSSNSQSLNFSQALSKSFANELMQDSFAYNINSNILDNSFFQPKQVLDQNLSDIQENQFQKTFNILKEKLNNVQIFEYEKLLAAYGNNFELIQKIIISDMNQIKILLEKYKRKKLKI